MTMTTQQIGAALAEAAEQMIRFTYTNWKGETAERRAVPIYLFFGTTEWHKEPGWLLRAFDMDKLAERDFALKDCDFATVELAEAPLVIRGEKGNGVKLEGWDENLLEEFRSEVSEKEPSPLDCPACGGSGHFQDAEHIADAVKAVALVEGVFLLAGRKLKVKSVSFSDGWWVSWVNANDRDKSGFMRLDDFLRDAKAAPVEGGEA